MTSTTTHASIFTAILRKLPDNISEMDKEILLDIILNVGDKDDSLQKFYKAVSIYTGFLTLGKINELSDRYKVHIVYKEYISDRFKYFEDVVFTVELKSRKLIASGEEVSYDIEAWCPPEKKILNRTDLLTIEKAGGLKEIVGRLYETGYVNYLRRLYGEAADERAVSKYAIKFESDRMKIAKSSDAG